MLSAFFAFQILTDQMRNNTIFLSFMLHVNCRNLLNLILENQIS